MTFLGDDDYRLGVPDEAGGRDDLGVAPSGSQLLQGWECHTDQEAPELLRSPLARVMHGITGPAPGEEAPKGCALVRIHGTDRGVLPWLGQSSLESGRLVTYRLTPVAATLS